MLSMPAPKPLRLKLVELADAYAAAMGLSRATVSDKVMGAGHVLDGVADGRDVTTATFERAVKWFDGKWPKAATWPSNLQRPSLVAKAKRTEAG